LLQQVCQQSQFASFCFQLAPTILTEPSSFHTPFTAEIFPIKRLPICFLKEPIQSAYNFFSDASHSDNDQLNHVNNGTGQLQYQLQLIHLSHIQNGHLYKR